MATGCLTVVLTLAAAGVAAAQQAADPADAPDESEEPGRFNDKVDVVGRKEEFVLDAPATVTVIPAHEIEQAAATNVGDLFRRVPGVNVAQMGARDINITTRSATSALATRQLAVVDGRSIYLDFFGMVMWDLVPANLHEIRQIEVLRGPASAVWGAHAMLGVVNVITRSPRELAAESPSSLVLTAGAFGRALPERDADPGALVSVHGTHARILDDRWAYKVSAGYTAQDALPRPAGTMSNAFRTPYPPYANSGTSQPKFDARVDRDTAQGRLTFAGGVAATAGIIHSGIGPFDISPGSRLSYLSGRYEQGLRRMAVFANFLDGDATNLIARRWAPAAQTAMSAGHPPLPLQFSTRTVDLDLGDARVIHGRHLVNFGGNLRHNRFNISLAPDGRSRTEGGAYVQGDIVLTQRLRAAVGARVDRFSSIDGAVFSPRAALVVKLRPSHAIRLSFNRAFSAPSFINNHLAEDGIFFTQAAGYTAAAPPPTWPDGLPPAVLSLLPPPGLPSRFTFLNLGRVREQGVETGVEVEVVKPITVFANHSWQRAPVVRGFDPQEVNVPPTHRLNAGVHATVGRVFGTVSVSATGSAYWQDVLDARFAGETEAYTLVNGAIGLRWLGGRLVTSVKGTNLANRAVMQHVFGDVVKRHVVGEARIRF